MQVSETRRTAVYYLVCTRYAYFLAGFYAVVSVWMCLFKYSDATIGFV